MTTYNTDTEAVRAIAALAAALDRAADELDWARVALPEGSATRAQAARAARAAHAAAQAAVRAALAARAAADNY